jgi:mannonate dehydratase
LRALVPVRIATGRRAEASDGGALPDDEGAPTSGRALTAAAGDIVRIADVRAICTAPAGIRLVVVKVLTSDDGLYGLGCATFTQRPRAVVSAVEEYLRPMLVGRDIDCIEDIHQACSLSAYWRSGPVLNNALSGVDEALWDLLGKRLGVPVYRLFGGRCRQAADVYAHASGADAGEVAERAAALAEQGFRFVRCQVGVAGMATYGAGGSPAATAPAVSGRADIQQSPWEPAAYCRLVPRLFERLRSELGEELELLHDVHERVPPMLAVRLAKDLEPYRLFFLEDVVAPEDVGYLPMLRAQTATPIALGELFVNEQEYVPLVRDRLIDFIRVHLSDIGGLTPARKLAALCDWFGVRTAWHGPGDVSPVGHAANLHLDLACRNFGVQEITLFDERTREVFPGCPEVRDGALWCNERPGLGVDLDERAAARFPFPDHPLNGSWPELRRRDGTVTRP